MSCQSNIIKFGDNAEVHNCKTEKSGQLQILSVTVGSTTKRFQLVDTRVDAKFEFCVILQIADDLFHHFISIHDAHLNGLPPNFKNVEQSMQPVHHCRIDLHHHAACDISSLFLHRLPYQIPQTGNHSERAGNNVVVVSRKSLLYEYIFLLYPDESTPFCMPISFRA